MEVGPAPARFDDGGLAPPALVEGVRLFNARDFFECHEVLEDAWRAERGPLRALLQGLIKAAVAFHHAGNGNLEGAEKVLRSGLAQLCPFATWPGRARRSGESVELESLPVLRLP